MDIKSKFQKESIIKINVLKIDNKKLSKSLIEQLHEQNPFDEDYNFIADVAFGYVKLGIDKVLIYSNNEKLFKFNINFIEKISSLNSEMKYNSAMYRTDISQLIRKKIKSNRQNTIDKNALMYNERKYEDKTIKEVLNDKEFQIFNLLTTNAGIFVEELNNHQIYI